MTNTTLITRFWNEQDQLCEVWRNGRLYSFFVGDKDKPVISKLSSEQMIKLITTYANRRD